MNTPGHYILNLALLGNVAPQNLGAIAIGAMLPDVPIFIFYFVAKHFYKMPEGKIWSEAYYEPLWQNIVALFHSIPLALIGAVVFYYLDWKLGIILCVSMVFHSLLDLPVHNDDAHRHFFPLSNYRFISPFSYWDINHHGKIVSLVEMALVLAVNPIVISLLDSPWTKGIVIAIDLFYLLGYFRFYLFT
ncbi:hypothetical protein IQ255_03700 [Pleurocapsales cyanobacterium LEGE 10410]|nr:hypothetical protein [Pleurocapsales cyanobacterium LEGE 10410]